MVNFGPLAAEIVSLVWGTAANFNGFRVLAALQHSQTAVLNRGCHLYSAGRPSRWALTHISSIKLVGRSLPYCKDVWGRYCCLTIFFPIVDACLICEDIARQSCAMVRRWRFLHHFCVLYLQRAPCSTFQSSDLHSKFALGKRHVWKYGRHPICGRWD